MIGIGPWSLLQPLQLVQRCQILHGGNHRLLVEGDRVVVEGPPGLADGAEVAEAATAP